MSTESRLAGAMCERCGAVKTQWHRQGPQSQHAFKVVCAGCEKFLKWGTVPEYESLSIRGLTEYVEYAPPPPPASLQKFFE